MMRDRDFGMVRATAFGIYAIRVTDPGIFIKDLVGTDNRFTLDEIQANLRGKIGLRIKEVMPELGIPVIEMEAKVTELGTRLRDRLQPDFAAMGLELVEVQVQDIGLPEEVEKAIDKRGAMAAVGDLKAYTQYETASSIRDAANNPGGAAGVGVGLGAGVAMGAQMMNSMGGMMGGAAVVAARPRAGRRRFRARRCSMSPWAGTRPDPSTWARSRARWPRTSCGAIPSCGRPAWRNGRRRATCPSSRRCSPAVPPPVPQ
jgi:membrane protease subunit (stomatin/prohibitin family)